MAALVADCVSCRSRAAWVTCSCSATATKMRSCSSVMGGILDGERTSVRFLTATIESEPQAPTGAPRHVEFCCGAKGRSSALVATDPPGFGGCAIAVHLFEQTLWRLTHK